MDEKPLTSKIGCYLVSASIGLAVIGFLLIILSAVI